MPTKTEVLCYACGYRFWAAGKTQRLLCPKCRTELNQGDFRIDGPHAEAIKTIGRVHIGPKGVVSGTTIIARTICLEGKIQDGELQGYASIELGGSPQCLPENLNTPHLVILEGGAVSFKRKLTCQDLTLRGTLSGSVQVSGTVIIQAGGHARGTLKTGHLIVEDGGGITANCTIDADQFGVSPAKGSG